MFQDWKNAWRDAVENFRRELAGDERPAAGERDRLRAMQKDVSIAASELRRIEREIEAARRHAAAERAEEAVCRRRESMARNIGDDETAAVAERFALRHAERAGVLERKAEALEAERALLHRELVEMERIVNERKLEVGAGPADTAADAAAARDAAAPGAARPGLEKDEAADAEFRRMEREQRERQADALLEELKKRMR